MFFLIDSLAKGPLCIMLFLIDLFVKGAFWMLYFTFHFNLRLFTALDHDGGAAGLDIESETFLDKAMQFLGG